MLTSTVAKPLPAISLAVLCTVSLLPAADPPAPKAARSVHLWYTAPEGTDFYNEVTVEKSTTGSYFAVCGFKHGYFGIQELMPGRGKVAIFSVWDPGSQNDPKAVAADRRVEVLHQGKDVRVGRFGGEGTGAQSFYTYPWKSQETYRFLIRAKVSGKKTAYAAYFYLNAPGEWHHLATFQTLSNGEALKGYYSFVEDFRRDGKSVQETRRAQYGNGWVRTLAGDWVALTKATFTADATPLHNIDAGVSKQAFFLATGGDTVNGTELKSVLTRSPVGVPLPD